MYNFDPLLFEPFLTIYARLDLDHTADIQVHSWGPSLEEAIKYSVYGLMDYMTDRGRIIEDAALQRHLQVRAPHLEGALYEFLDECLFGFCVDPFMVVTRVEDIKVARGDTEGEVCIECEVYGGTFDPKVHPWGTEVKAITSSNLIIKENQERCDTYVILDI